ncbi:hypothetical protein HAX54_036985 [Datura stramonium]|uniref:Uncharacterized protein n=1 Tax=Datura stramonium TaxID=4076 RepID=A0ABS8VIV5_DATST|nr:hypothetical protein [Datura stramonium]
MSVKSSLPIATSLVNEDVTLISQDCESCYAMGELLELAVIGELFGSEALDGVAWVEIDVEKEMPNISHCD